MHCIKNMKYLTLFTLMATTACMVANAAKPQKYNRSADPHAFTVFMKDGGWCWYQDPRVIAHDGKLFIGSVKGNDSGPALVGIYNLDQKKPIGTVLMQDNFDKDDHNSPVFHVRPDGSVLSVYAKHGRDVYHYYRISDPVDPMKWSEEYKHALVSSDPKDHVTYMNLMELKDEGKLYNFYRGINYNPTFETSTDSGKTWSDAVHFVQSEVGKRARPYARYVGNGIDTIHVSTTDAHPRNYGNSIYYFEFRDGKFFKADGTFIKDLKDGPVLPSQTEVVYHGTGPKGPKSPEAKAAKGKGGADSADGAAWTSSIMLDAEGHPHIGYTLYISRYDHRYRIASWDGTQWLDREVAFGGNNLHSGETSYTGLITIDPVDPTAVYIATDVNPTTGEDLDTQHEIYRAKIGLADDVSSIQWEAVTQNSPVMNIRPVIVRHGDKRIVLWNRGEFDGFKNYDLDTVGFVERK
ncbi:BNR-4 repeat-containing protein [Pontiella sulfatireligans]|uniref:Sialidase domain-containing protein n=1 Tax=Pontiella sulfatireligans TaxID=2750658 RepID=A0A6C2UEY8_9BACT|nr:BNR-4 repeat-containing protein [Pontiella sulfatireligans]VGO18097.1 hypothetical protein SCARR_00148 [Pontiella sulfatireligans]